MKRCPACGTDLDEIAGRLRALEAEYPQLADMEIRAYGRDVVLGWRLISSGAVRRCEVACPTC